MVDSYYRRVKWALIGAGFFGEMYAQIMTSLPNVELVSLFSAHD
jgi:predicted dehydrogenase